MVLVKGGEDLRLDQRIEQLFGVINRIMGKNCECEKRELFLKKFEVTPMKRWMGVLEWVDSTQVLREFVEREFREVRDPAGDLITKNSSFQARNRFLETLSGETERIAKHKPLLFCD
jgi:DNA-dependent protein kinase catalytic subunit